jgi:hypothetical protein
VHRARPPPRSPPGPPPEGRPLLFRLNRGRLRFARAYSYIADMLRNPTIKLLTEAVRAAERELEAARKRSELDAAARRLQRAKAELKRLEQANSAPKSSG